MSTQTDWEEAIAELRILQEVDRQLDEIESRVAAVLTYSVSPFSNLAHVPGYIRGIIEDEMEAGLGVRRQTVAKIIGGELCS